jgi:hypothetical protein
VAESSWPSPASGRVLNDSQYEKLGLSYGVTGGVVGDFTNPQLVYGDSTGLQVKVAADRYALVRGHEWWSGSSILTLAIGANSSGSTRTDLVVLRLSRTTWDVNVIVLPGTPGGGAPSPTQNLGTTGSWDLPLATVTVANSASTITSGNVTYVGAHLSSCGQYRVATSAGLTYIPLPTSGMEAVLADGTKYRYDTNAWVLKAFAGALGQRQLFTPVLTAATTNPTLGTSPQQSGWYCYGPGPTVTYDFFIRFGTGSPTPGSGNYSVTLPVQAAGMYSSGITAHGDAVLADASAPAWKTASVYVAAGAVGATAAALIGDVPISNGFPWTWAANDYVSGQITYPI